MAKKKLKDKSLIISNDIYYPAILEEIKKSRDPFKPMYEAFTNALESIKLSRDGSKSVNVALYLKTGTVPDVFFFDQAVIEDTGIGFNKENFERLNRYKDTRKGFANRGTGRIQFLHFFDTSEYRSIFKDKKGYKKRTFTLTKHYLSKNAIISNHHIESIPGADSPRTVVTLRTLLDKKDQAFYNNITAAEFKLKLISHYMMDFCTHRDSLPIITISHFINDNLIEKVFISADDVPKIDKEKKIEVRYFRLNSNGRDFEETTKQEQLKLTSFVIDEGSLEKNEIKLTSKGEVIGETKVELENLAPKDRLNGKRYLFLISGNYIDNRDGNTRGVVNIPKREEFKKDKSENQDLFNDEEIFLDDIEAEANYAISTLYKEIGSKKEAKQQDVEKLKEMFLLNEATVRSVRIGLEDTEEKILEKVYAADSKTVAKKDAEIKKCIDQLDELDPSSDDYGKKLDSIILELVKSIPLQNRTALTHFVARRKLVLDLFRKTIQRELAIQNSGQKNNDEQLLHNLIFQQSSSSPEESDLWLLNEDFIYFKGTSEGRLCDIKINGQKMFREEITLEEEAYLLSLGQNRKILRPDILLFPGESRCIIIEFKNPEVNVSEHLSQINRYASLIRNFTRSGLPIDMFYGYLIGEKVSAEDVRDYDADFKEAYHFDYVFRPYKTIAGKDGRPDGSLYTEVLKYTTLLERASSRNEHFIKRIVESNKAIEPPSDVATLPNQFEDAYCADGK